jgi:hypothetical protein
MSLVGLKHLAVVVSGIYSLNPNGELPVGDATKATANIHHLEQVIPGVRSVVQHFGILSPFQQLHGNWSDNNGINQRNQGSFSHQKATKDKQCPNILHPEQMPVMARVEHFHLSHQSQEAPGVNLSQFHQHEAMAVSKNLNLNVPQGPPHRWEVLSPRLFHTTNQLLTYVAIDLLVY